MTEKPDIVLNFFKKKIHKMSWPLFKIFSDSVLAAGLTSSCYCCKGLVSRKCGVILLILKKVD
jgi:hypothetical protein